MLRFLNIIAILALVGSAVYAYSIKYQTSYRAEQIAKTKIEIRQERDAIAVLRAEWAYMTRPERIQQLADAYLPGMKQLEVLQIVAAQSLPERSPRVDSIGHKLDTLGLSMPATPPVAAAPRRRRPKRRDKAKSDTSHDRRPMRDTRPSPSPAHRMRALLRALFSTSLALSGARMRLAALGFLALYAVIAIKLVYLGFKPEAATTRRAAAEAVAASRPDIIDRNGEVLASDVKVMSVFAEPRRIIDKDEATELLTAVLPGLNARELRERLGSRKGFVWVKREVTPHQRDEVFHLGLPGVGLIAENKRVYPNGPIGAHVLGFANVDNQGIAGIEKYIDGQGLADLHGAGFGVTPEELKPVSLSLDMRATHALRDELEKGVTHFKAKAAPRRSSTSTPER